MSLGATVTGPGKFKHFQPPSLVSLNVLMYSSKHWRTGLYEYIQRFAVQLCRNSLQFWTLLLTFRVHKHLFHCGAASSIPSTTSLDCLLEAPPIIPIPKVSLLASVMGCEVEDNGDALDLTGVLCLRCHYSSNVGPAIRDSPSSLAAVTNGTGR